MHKNILLVDDDDDLRELVSFFLRQAGFIVGVAKDGFDAFEHLGRNHYDLIIMDINMPHLSGFDLVKSVRADKRHESLPVIMLTGRQEKHAILRVKDYVSDYVIKPPVREDLLARVERVLGGKPQFEEVSFAASEQRACGSLGMEVQLRSISNNGLVLASPVALPKSFRIKFLDIPVLAELQLKQTDFEIFDCASPQQGYEYFISFFGIDRSDQDKIREWVMVNSFARKSQAR